MPMLKLKLIRAAGAKKNSRVNSNAKARMRPCNLCGEAFKAPNPFCCFCEDCKQHHELYRFHDWLPDELTAA
ncbi:MAG: hypothetical protein ACXVB9_17905 [Bdellovibrionota bacterium]